MLKSQARNWRATAPEEFYVSDMPVRRDEMIVDPELANAIRVHQARLNRERELAASTERIGEHQRLKLVAQQATEAGQVEGYRLGHEVGVRWGMLTGGIAGSLLTGAAFWLAMTTINALGLRL